MIKESNTKRNLCITDDIKVCEVIPNKRKIYTQLISSYQK